MSNEIEVKKLNKNIYLVDYGVDYGLDALLSKGVRSVFGLLSYCRKYFKKSRKELKARVDSFGCSAFICTTPEGDNLLCRNFDYKEAPCFAVWTSPLNGYKSISMVDGNMMFYGYRKEPSEKNISNMLMAPYLTLDGMNEKGLCVSILQVKAKKNRQKRGKTPIVNTVALRAMLDKAKNTDEAIDLLNSYDMKDLLFGCTYHYMLSDAKGDYALVEYSDGKMHVLKEKSATNFYLCSQGRTRRPEGVERYKMINECLKSYNGCMTAAEALKTLNKVHLDYNHPKYPWQIISLWSVVYNSSSKEAIFAAGLDYGKIYSLKPDKPMEVTEKEDNAVIDDYVKWIN